MGKKTLNTTLEESPQGQVTKLADKVIFEPTSSQAKVKARFWTRFRPGPLTAGRLTMDKVLEVTNSAGIRKWWHEPGFVEWFMNKEEERERLKYLFNKGLDMVERIIDDPDANANAKANLFKMLAEMNGHLGKKPVEKFADEEVAKMSEDQLAAFIEKKGFKFVKENIINVGSESKEDGSAEEAGTDSEATDGN